MATATAVRPGGATSTAAGGGEGEEAPAPGGRKKLLLVVVVVIALVAAGAWWFLLRPSGGEAAAEPEPVPGDVVALEAISINLADGHYLRVGIALQATADAAHAPEGSQALNLLIDTFTGRSVEELAVTETRAALQEELVHQVEEAYHHEVMDVYFTEFVTQ
jgi:flagellar FliL protein